jgi:hypothetical protein
MTISEVLGYTRQHRNNSAAGHCTNVRYWHLADISAVPANVRFRGKADISRIVKCPLITQADIRRSHKSFI